MMRDQLTIYCADIGSVANNRFGWARLDCGEGHKGECIFAFVNDIACTLANGRHVALGFECPLWAPVSTDPQRLTEARPVDGNRSWSAGAGATVLATGLTQVAWILDEVRSRLNDLGTPLPSVFFSWPEFKNSESGLFFWEAFVTGKAKASGSEDAQDALTACQKFADLLPDPAEKCDPEQVRSLIGGAILWSNWSENLELLRMPCLVVRPDA